MGTCRAAVFAGGACIGRINNILSVRITALNVHAVQLLVGADDRQGDRLRAVRMAQPLIWREDILPRDALLVIDHRDRAAHKRQLGVVVHLAAENDPPNDGHVLDREVCPIAQQDVHPAAVVRHQRTVFERYGRIAGKGQRRVDVFLYDKFPVEIKGECTPVDREPLSAREINTAEERYGAAVLLLRGGNGLGERFIVLPVDPRHARILRTGAAEAARIEVIVSGAGLAALGAHAVPIGVAPMLDGDEIARAIVLRRPVENNEIPGRAVGLIFLKGNALRIEHAEIGAFRRKTHLVLVSVGSLDLEDRAGLNFERAGALPADAAYLHRAGKSQRGAADDRDRIGVGRVERAVGDGHIASETEHQQRAIISAQPLAAEVKREASGVDEHIGAGHILQERHGAAGIFLRLRGGDGVLERGIEHRICT